MGVGWGSLTHSFSACVCFLVTFREAVASQSVIAHVSLALLALFQSRQPARFPSEHDICSLMEQHTISCKSQSTVCKPGCKTPTPH